jgi:hypothetical protein
MEEIDRLTNEELRMWLSKIKEPGGALCVWINRHGEAINMIFPKTKQQLCITFDAKLTGKRSAGNPHAVFEEAGVGDGPKVRPRP